MTDFLQRLAAVLAVAASVAAIEGVLFNYFYFFALKPSLLSTLTMGDHLSTAAAQLPMVCAGMAVGTFWAYLDNRDRAKGVQVPGPPNFRKRFWIPITFLLLAVTIIGFALGFRLGLMPFLLILIFLVLLRFWQGPTVAELVATVPAYVVRLVFTLFIVTVIVCFNGYLTGRTLLEFAAADQVLVADGERLEGFLVGIYERGTFFLTKPANKIIFVPPRAGVRLEDLRENATPSSRDRLKSLF
jgi:hypothetical protein